MKLKEFSLKLNVDLSKHKLTTLKSLYEFIKNKQTIKTYDYEIKKIKDLLIYDFSEYNIIKRLEDIKKCGKSPSTKAYILRYGETEGLKRKELYSKKLSYKNSRKYLEDKYKDKTIVESLLKLRCPNNIETLKLKYPLNWQEKLDNYMKSYKYANSKNGYIEKYGKIEGNIKWEERLQKSKKTNSLNGYIERHGKEKGTKIWYDKISKASYKLSKQYYIDLYGEELGAEMCKNNSLYYKLKVKYGEEKFKEFLLKKYAKAKENGVGTKQFYIKKYGEEKGNLKWNSIIHKLKRCHTLPYFIEKYGNELGLQKYNLLRKRLLCNFLHLENNKSKISLELFFILKDKLGNDNCKFKHNNNELFIHNKDLNKIFYYDFTYKNKIIEFNGDFWHMNPKKYKETDINKVTKYTAKEIWQYDMQKQLFANENGYETMYIWESDYLNNKEEIINNCLKFLKS